MRTLTYRDLRRFNTFEERFAYLNLNGQVADETFGVNRYLNQSFYTSTEWKRVRNVVIARDNGCDLGIPGREVYDKIIVHHMMPMTPEDIEFGNPLILDPDNLISVSHLTHNAIHYGDISRLPQPYVERTAGDTTLWASTR